MLYRTIKEKQRAMCSEGQGLSSLRKGGGVHSCHKKLVKWNNMKNGLIIEVEGVPRSQAIAHCHHLEPFSMAGYPRLSVKS